jgi:UDP-glucose 4-epimerase
MWPARFSSSATVYGIPQQIPIAETPQLLTAWQRANPCGYAIDEE